jgi:hypothetical protein
MKDLKYSVDAESSVRPALISGSSAVNGVGVDKLGFDDAMAIIATGAAAGTPDSFSLAVKVQESADNSTGWADVTGATATITAVNTVARVKVPDMLNRKRYLRIVVTPTFVGGTSPSVGVSANFALSRKTDEPVA